MPKPTTANNHIAVKTILEKRSVVDKKYFLTEKAINGINEKKKKMIARKHGFGAQYLDPDRPSYTIPARYWKDGYDALVWYSDNDIRRLTESELKKIQTFPNDFIFTGTKKDVIIQIGNAVASNFAMEIGKYLIKKLDSHKDKINNSEIDMCIKEMKYEVGLIGKKKNDCVARFDKIAKTYRNIGLSKS